MSIGQWTACGLIFGFVFAVLSFRRERAAQGIRELFIELSPIPLYGAFGVLCGWLWNL